MNSLYGGTVNSQKIVFNVGCVLRVCVKGKRSFTSIALEKDMWRATVA